MTSERIPLRDVTDKYYPQLKQSLPIPIPKRPQQHLPWIFHYLPTDKPNAEIDRQAREITDCCTKCSQAEEVDETHRQTKVVSKKLGDAKRRKAMELVEAKSTKRTQGDARYT